MRFTRTLAAGILASTVTLSLAGIPSYATTRLDSRDAGATTLAASRADAGTGGVSIHPADTAWMTYGDFSFLTRAAAVAGISLCKQAMTRIGRNPDAYGYKVEYSELHQSWLVLFRYIY